MINTTYHHVAVAALVAVLFIGWLCLKRMRKHTHLGGHLCAAPDGDMPVPREIQEDEE